MIVVTGGAGFIGSNLISALNRRGETKIAVVDRLDASAKFLNLNALDFVDYIDHGDTSALDAICANAKAIFHLGACADTTETDGRYMMENNFTFSKQMLQRATRNEIPFVYASSAAVYGLGKEGFREEKACESPLNVYATSKLCIDNYVRAHLPDFRSPVVGLRFFNVYGPQENHKEAMASVAFHLFGQLQGGEAMALFEGSREFLRDFVYVDDAVAVTLDLFDHRISGIFNCGTGHARSFYDVAANLRDLEGGGEIASIPFPKHLKGKYQSHTEADLTRLRAAGC
ncbi:MAG: ADP-glyceromanno-heptose 6-epimerase, partial [Deltaproteobacteria bacterium]|nr:ADP-glyceromanno-heptose 6-epimerase [Deltaproteobacteria bacterium]